MPTLLPPIEQLVRALRRLPGIGEKTATRLTYFLLAAPESVAGELGEAILRLHQEVVICTECFNVADHTPCKICSDPARSVEQLCVVEEPADLASIEKSGVFQGRYHVLGGRLAPLEGVGPEALRIAPLVSKVRGGEVKEVILATNPSPEGEATALLVAERLAPYDVPITRIGYGMPVGGHLEYVDEVTIRKSPENRRRFGT